MSDVLVSINRNKLRISLVDPKEGFRSHTEELTENVLMGRSIEDVATFASILSNSVSKLTKIKPSKLDLHFILEPQDVTARFVMVNKNNGTADEQIITEIKSKLTDINLEDLYFSYQKIAPFMYQFIGMDKHLLEKLCEVAQAAGMSLKSVIPWVMLLPKYVKTNNPAIFICKRDDMQVIALSELNGIFFTGVYEKEKSVKELSEFVHELSFYKRSTPISNVFTLNYDSFSMPDYAITKVEMPVAPLDPEETKGYEVNVLTSYMIETDPSILNSQINALNLLPLPVVAEKKPVVAYAGRAIVAVAAIALIFGIFNLVKGKNNATTAGNLASNSSPNSNVLSDTSKVPESAPPAEVKPVLNKGDLKIRVENGAGVAGLAAKTKEFLSGLGYNIVSIDTADSEQQDTVLKFKKDKVQYKDLVVADMKSKFPGIVVEDTLPDSVSYDLLVTVGKSSNL